MWESIYIFSIIHATALFVLRHISLDTLLVISTTLAPTMPLCLICKSIPFRKIVEGARSLPVTNLQNGGPDGYFVRSHDSIAHLIASGKSCKLCDTVAKSIESSSWYQSITRDEDRCKPVWLHLPIGSWCPMIWIYLGNDAPETRVFGKDVKICIALGKLWGSVIPRNR
jgi:hypothetical protein